jgi:hypothetical protein
MNAAEAFDGYEEGPVTFRCVHLLRISSYTNVDQTDVQVVSL